MAEMTNDQLVGYIVGATYLAATVYFLIVGFIYWLSFKPAQPKETTKGEKQMSDFKFMTDTFFWIQATVYMSIYLWGMWEMIKPEPNQKRQIQER